MKKYCAFDIEIARSVADFDNWRAFRPLGITCAATRTSDGERHTWYGRSADDKPAERMSAAEAAELVSYLQAQAATGATILTWNGLAFDLDVLAEESSLLAECRSLALDHVDMMFHLFCLKGYPLGLDKAARGMGVPGKPPGMSGELAPRYWAEGRRDEILYYVEQDARITLEVARAVEKQGELRWTSAAGKKQVLPLPGGWLTVRQAMALPLPDVSWMKRPWPRSRFTGWLQSKP